jgi:hypothetical protein
MSIKCVFLIKKVVSQKVIKIVFVKYQNLRLNKLSSILKSWMNKFKGGSFRLVILGILVAVAMCNDVKGVRLSADNVCTFHIVDRLFSLIYLQGVDPYVIDINENEKVKFNFCHSFVPV